MSRLQKTLMLVLTAVAALVPFRADASGVTYNDACADGTTCCTQASAACQGLIGYYDKGCAGPCGQRCPK